MKKQTFIICLEDEDGKTIDFERWTFKKVETCIDHMIMLYNGYYSVYKDSLDKAAHVVAYPTPDGYNRSDAVWKVSADEFRKLLKA